MGITRKTASMLSMGLVDFRSDKERTARYTRQTRNATRAQVAQNMAALDVQRQQLTQGHVQHVEAQAQRIAPLGPDAYAAVPAAQTSPAYGLPAGQQYQLPAGSVAGPRAGWFVDEHRWRHYWDGRQWVGRPQQP